MLYLLPTRSDTKYRGKYPNRIKSASYSPHNTDGKGCIHLETNCGERFTASADCIADIQSVRIGVDISDYCKAGTLVVAMMQSQYDEWLASIRARRAFNPAI
jgi:hypothetical protein